MNRNPIVLKLLQKDYQRTAGSQLNRLMRADKHLQADTNLAVTTAPRPLGVAAAVHRTSPPTMARA
jgi:hypothetical protein